MTEANTPTAVGGIKYPLPCGCHGPKEISMCLQHETEAMLKRRRALGIGVNAELGALRACLKEAIKERGIHGTETDEHWITRAQALFLLE